MSRRKKLSFISLGLWGISILLYSLAKWVPGFADLYTVHIYRNTARLLSRFSALVPFSVTELLLFLILLLFCAALIRLFVRLVRLKEGRRGLLLSFASRFFFASSLLLFLYTVNCGINYYRTDFFTLSGRSECRYTVKDLTAYCTYLSAQLKELEPLTEKEENGLTKALPSCYREGAKAMRALGGQYPLLSGYYPEAKPVLFSQLLSYQQLCGIYSPFTIEANINRDMPGFYIPMTICHELSHLKGFMQEEEANYIGCLACIRSDDANFQYSGYLVAWLYAADELYHYDKAAYAALLDSLCDTAIRDLSANSAFWDAYEGKVAEVSSLINDSYLKANGQPDGILSYNRVVSLLIGDYLARQR